MTDETILDYGGEWTRSEVIAFIRGVADDLHRAESLTVTVDGRTIAIDGPPGETVEVEVEIERESRIEGPDTIEVEFELEWEIEPDASPTDGTETDERQAVEKPEGSDDDHVPETAAAPDDADSPVAAGSPDTAVASDGTDIESLAEFQIYRDRGGEWRWRLRHPNGNIIATGGEGYPSREKAEKGLRSVKRNAPGAETVLEEE